ncbi:MAG: tRNA-intron lyase [Desulfurococcales archaeon]|nr:tRNA-intron lyase [Desulfurococcales archaeon]
MTDQIPAYLIGDNVLVPDPHDARKLYDAGFYGKPIGIEKPGKVGEWEAPLQLSLIEAIYLSKKGMIKIIDPSNSREIEWKAILSMLPDRAKQAYLVYEDLRERGLIVKSGLKYGSDFAVYRLGPGIDHAPYMVHVASEEDPLDPVEIVRAGRLGHSVKKAFLIASVSESGNITYIMFKWYRP